MTARIKGIYESDLREMHDNKDMSPHEISNCYGVSATVIYNRIREYGIIPHPRGNRGRTRIYALNKDFFKILNNESAWVYGWALGDGSYTDPYIFRIAVSRKDKEVLYKFQKLLRADHPIVDYTTWDKRAQREYKASRFDLYSVELVCGLKKILYTEMPISCLNHFVRGFWEAEGGVYQNNNKNIPKGWSLMSGFYNKDKNILRFIFQSLQEIGIVQNGSLRENKAGVWALIFSVNDSVSLYHYIYDNCKNMFLKRKKERFDELIDKHLSYTGRVPLAVK